MTRPYIIAIAGASGSGKSTLVQRIASSEYGGEVSLLPHDAYYRGAGDMPEALRRAENWDHPDSLDNELYVEHINQLASGRAVDRPVYDFASHSRTERTERVEARSVLLLEGILLLALPEVRSRAHLRLFVETPADLCVVRRMVRDVDERGRTVASVAEQYRSTVRPMYEEFVAPSRAHADVIVPWVSHNDAAVELLLARIAAVCEPEPTTKTQGS